MVHNVFLVSLLSHATRLLVNVNGLVHYNLQVSKFYEEELSV